MKMVQNKATHLWKIFSTKIDYVTTIVVNDRETKSPRRWNERKDITHTIFH